MSLIAYIIILFLSGLFVGALARLALPGRDPMTIMQTAAVGIAGSLIAGLISLALAVAAGSCSPSYARRCWCG